MRIQEHIKLSTAAAFITLPWLKQDVWIPFAASIFIDSDHYLWHAVTQRTLSLRAAMRYFSQPDPPQRPLAKFLHRPLVLGPLVLIALLTRSRTLWLILAGLLFHVSLDAIHISQMSHLKQSLSEQANTTCPACGQHCDSLQLHTVYFAPNIFDRYNPQHFVVLCPSCHDKAHRRKKAGVQRTQSFAGVWGVPNFSLT